MIPTSRPRQLAAYKKIVSERDWQADADEAAKHIGLRLVSGKTQNSPDYKVRATITHKGQVLSDDIISTPVGRWNIIETNDAKKYRFLISQTDKKDMYFIAFGVEYVFDKDGLFLMTSVAYFPTLPASKETAAFNGSNGREYEYGWKFVVDKVSQPADTQPASTASQPATTQPAAPRPTPK